ncbi:MAG: extracellular solute-binding protein [Thermomicrobiales bacterium]|nr:extracellular solute-binding protein [Thermomicrobiales bacterium]
MPEWNDRVNVVFSRRDLLKGAGAAGTAIAVGNLHFGAAGAQENVTLTIWTNHPEWLGPLNSLLSAFSATTPHVAFELTGVPGPDYFAKLQTALAGEQVSDIVGLVEGYLLSQGPAAFPIKDLTGIVDPNLLIDSARTQVEIDGSVWAVPLASYTVGLAVQNPIVAENNITLPTTWDELKATCQTLVDAGVTPLILGGKDGVHTFFIYAGLVSTILGPEGFEELRAGTRKLTDPDLLEAAQLLKDLQPYYNEGFEATDYVTAKALFAQGLGAMMVAGTADFTGFKQENPDADLGFIPWPGKEVGLHSTNTGMELLYAVNNTMSAEKQDAAGQFVAWLATAEAQTIVAESIALPINNQVTELSDPIKAGTLEVRDRDVIVWYDVPETANTLTAVTEVSGQLWTGDITPEEFAQYVQDNLAGPAS